MGRLSIKGLQKSRKNIFKCTSCGHLSDFFQRLLHHNNLKIIVEVNQTLGIELTSSFNFQSVVNFVHV